jgi:hypothetical protein
MLKQYYLSFHLIVSLVALFASSSDCSGGVA